MFLLRGLLCVSSIVVECSVQEEGLEAAEAAMKSRDPSCRCRLCHW